MFLFTSVIGIRRFFCLPSSTTHFDQFHFICVWLMTVIWVFRCTHEKIKLSPCRWFCFFPFFRAADDWTGEKCGGNVNRMAVWLIQDTLNGAIEVGGERGVQQLCLVVRMFPMYHCSVAFWRDTPCYRHSLFYWTSVQCFFFFNALFFCVLYIIHIARVRLINKNDVYCLNRNKNRSSFFSLSPSQKEVIFFLHVILFWCTNSIAKRW